MMRLKMEMRRLVGNRRRDTMTAVAAKPTSVDLGKVTSRVTAATRVRQRQKLVFMAIRPAISCLALGASSGSRNSSSPDVSSKITPVT